MKRISLGALSFVATLFCCSCVKEQNAGSEVSADKIGVVMTAQVEEPESRMSLASTMFSWNEGDNINLRWADQAYSSNTECEVLTAVQGGKIARFEGDFSVYKEGANLYAYYSTDGSFVSRNSIAFRKEVPSKQKGSAVAISENLLFYSWIKKADIELVKNGEVISGMNIPMIVKLVRMRRKKLMDAVQESAQSGQHYIMVASQFLGKKNADTTKTS